jgi:hypothetical protein
VGAAAAASSSDAGAWAIRVGAGRLFTIRVGAGRFFPGSRACRLILLREARLLLVTGFAVVDFASCGSSRICRSRTRLPAVSLLAVCASAPLTVIPVASKKAGTIAPAVTMRIFSNWVSLLLKHPGVIGQTGMSSR